MIFLLYFLLIFFLIIDKIKQRSFFAPSTFFNIVFISIISLYQLKISYLQQDLSYRTLLIFISSILSFNIGCLLIDNFSFKELKKIKSSNDKTLNKDIIHYIFILLFIVECIYSKGFPLLNLVLTGNSNYLHFGIPSLHGALNGLAICMSVFYIKKRDKKRFLYYLFCLMTFSRQVLISIIIESVACYCLSKKEKIKKINYKKVLVFIIMFVFSFGILGNIRSGNNTMNNLFMPKEQYKNLPNGIKWVYSYTTFSVSNFNNLVSITDGGITKGGSMLETFLPTVLLNKFNLPKFDKYYFVLINFNVSTAFTPIYLDFSFAGIIIFFMTIGFICNYYYKKYMLRKDLVNMMIYSVLLHNILLLFFVNMFLYLPVIIQLLYIPLFFQREGDLYE